MELDDPDTSAVFISLDSFVPDVILNDRPPASMPYLQQLLDDNLALTNCYCTGYPTQFALPGLLSSTLPLDYGGYEFGARDRPRVLAECFDDAGYRTAAFVSGFYLNRLYNYDRGFDTYLELGKTDAWSSVLRDRVVEFGHTTLESGDASEDEIVAILKPIVGEYLEAFERYCEERRAEVTGQTDYPTFCSPNVHGWDFDEAVSVATEGLDAFTADPDGFTRTLLREYPEDPYFDRVQELQRLVRNVGLRRNQRIRLTWSLLRAWSATNGHHVPMVSKNMRVLGRNLSDLLVRRPLSRSTSAGYVLENAAEWFTDTSGRTFSFMHLFDLHERNMESWEFDPDMLSDEFATLREHVRAIRRTGESYHGSMAYDLSARYLDSVLESLVERIYERAETPPLVVITADHGNSVSGVTPRRTSDYLTSFRDELLHVPAIFVHPSLPDHRFDGLCSSMDISATLLDLLGLEIPESFRGKPVSALPPDGRELVTAEGIGRGPCDGTFKPVNVCVRSRDQKLVCSVDLTTDDGLDVDWAFDLTSDPSEQRSLDVLDSGFDELLTRAKNRVDHLSRTELTTTKHVASVD